MRNLLGWSAWFVDNKGKGDVPTHPHLLSDHLNAAVTAGLKLSGCFEPVIDQATAERLAVSDAPVATAAALHGIPIVLVCQFEKPQRALNWNSERWAGGTMTRAPLRGRRLGSGSSPHIRQLRSASGKCRTRYRVDAVVCQPGFDIRPGAYFGGRTSQAHSTHG